MTNASTKGRKLKSARRSSDELEVLRLRAVAVPGVADLIELYDKYATLAVRARDYTANYSRQFTVTISNGSV